MYAIWISSVQITRQSPFTEVQQEFTQTNYFHSPLKQTLLNPIYSGFSSHKRVQSALLLPHWPYKLLCIFSITSHSLRRQHHSSQVFMKCAKQCKILSCCKLSYLGCCPPQCCWSHPHSKCWSQWRHWHRCSWSLSSGAAGHRPEEQQNQENFRIIKDDNLKIRGTSSYLWIFF